MPGKKMLPARGSAGGSRDSSRHNSASSNQRITPDGDNEPKESAPGKGAYITTGAEEEFEYLKLPNISVSKRARTHVLAGAVFTPPKLETLHRATFFRLSHVTKNKRLAANRRVARRRRAQRDASSGSESELEPSNRSFTTDKDDFEFDDDFDFDADDSMYAHTGERKQQDSMWQAVYRRMCGRLHVMVSHYILRTLDTTEIVMKHSILKPAGVKACCAALLHNITVKTLHLEGNGIGPEGARYIAELLAENMYITNLGVAENNIQTEGLLALKDVLRTNENITKLDLSGNNFIESDAVHIADSLEENTILKSLILHHNAFREQGGITLANALLNNDSLEELDLGWNHLRRRGVIALADAIAKNMGIIHLNVAWNGFYLEGSKALAKALKENKTVETLDLTCNRIDLECMMELIKGIKSNSTLTTLKLSRNPLSSQGAKELLEAISANPNVQISDIDISTQSIDVPFLRILDRIRDSERRIRVKHGIILDQSGSADAADEEFLHEDPMMVLMECMRMMNLRLIDLFSSLDKDQSKSLTHEEFKQGLISVHVPMSIEAIERLIKKLDKDGDGEVDYVELLEGQKIHQKKLRRLRTVESDLPYEETELGRISFKLRTLMTKRQAMMRARLEEERKQRTQDRLMAIKDANSFVREASKPKAIKKKNSTAY